MKGAPPKTQAGRGPATAPPSPDRDVSTLRPRLNPGTDQQGGEVEASPGEQAELDQVVIKALKMIHGRESRDATLKTLHDPSLTVPEVVGRAAYRVLSSVSDQKRATTKEPVSEDVLQEAAGVVVPELLKVGIAAGIFPIEDDSETREEVGNTESEFDRTARLAMLEATKAYGENELRGPNAERRTLDAQDDWAQGISEEVQAGQADPEYMDIARTALAPAGQQQGAAPAKRPQLIEEGA